MTTKTYTLNNTKKLIDLNGDFVNFRLTWKVESSNNSPYYVAIADQDSLDSGSDLEFEKHNGAIGGDISSSNNDYKNYSLVLKSDSPCECDITINIEEIEPNIQVDEEYNPPAHTDSKSMSINWKLVIVILLIIGGCILLYCMYKKTSKNVSKDKNIFSEGKLSDKPNTYRKSQMTPSPVIKAISPVISQSDTLVGVSNRALHGNTRSMPFPSPSPSPSPSIGKLPDKFRNAGKSMMERLAKLD
jgi:hypothetical protein